MPETTAVIRSKRLGNTGFTEAHASRAYGRGVSSRTVAIVELKVVKTSELDDGNEVEIVIENLYPVPVEGGEALDEHLRTITQTLDYNRRISDGTEPKLDGMPEPTPLKDVINSGVVFTSESDAEK